MTHPNSIAAVCLDAAELISQADGLVITAGAGIGVDSGLPDFRGDRGFWNAYPALGALGMPFTSVANPKAFKSMPALAWGFYGHRLKLYRDTAPHAGFTSLLELAHQMPHGAFVFTSNVDGHFQQAGFAPEHVAECHGSIHYLQCLDRCGEPTWSADQFEPVVDAHSCTLLSTLPTCPGCGGLARPNIMMFGDWDWDASRATQNEARLNAWFLRLQRPVVVEIGAGTAIPTVRLFGEELDCPLIRINPIEATVGLHRDIGIPSGALDGITRIVQALQNL